MNKIIFNVKYIYCVMYVQNFRVYHFIVLKLQQKEIFSYLISIARMRVPRPCRLIGEIFLKN